MKAGTMGSITRYAVSGVARQILNAAVAFARPMLLPPELFGLWTLVRAVPPYASFAHLGSRPAARFAIPYNLAAGREDENARIEGAIFWGALATNLLLALWFAVWGFLPGLSAPERAGMWTLSGLILVAWLQEHYVTVLKAYERFDTLSAANYLLPLINLATLPLIWLFSIYGLFVGAFAGPVLVTLYYRRRFPRPSPPFDRATFLRLVRRGFPIMALTSSVLLVRTTDRFVISGLLGNEALGHFGIAIMVFNFAMNLPASVREVIEPQMMAGLGENRPDFLREFLFRPLLRTAFFMPFVLGPAVLLAPATIRLLLPAYVPGIVSVQIVCLGGFFLALTYILRSVVVAMGLELRAALFGLGIAGGNVALGMGFIRAGWGLEGVAAATSISLGGLYLCLFRLLRRHAAEPDGWRRASWGGLEPFVALLAGLGALRLAFGAPQTLAPALGQTALLLLLLAGNGLLFRSSLLEIGGGMRHLLRWRDTGARTGASGNVDSDDGGRHA